MVAARAEITPQEFVFQNASRAVYTVARASRDVVIVDGNATGDSRLRARDVDFHIDRIVGERARAYVLRARDESVAMNNESVSRARASKEERETVEAEARAGARAVAEDVLALASARFSADVREFALIVIVRAVGNEVENEGARWRRLGRGTPVAFDGAPWVNAAALEAVALATPYVEFDSSGKTLGAYVELNSDERVVRSPVDVKYGDWARERVKFARALERWNEGCARRGEEHLKCAEYVLTRYNADIDGFEFLEGLTSNFMLVYEVDGQLVGRCAAPGADALDGVAMRALKKALALKNIPVIEDAPEVFDSKRQCVAAYITTALKGVVPLDFIVIHRARRDAQADVDRVVQSLERSRALIENP